MPCRRVVILFNPIAGAGRSARIADDVLVALRRAGHDAACVPTSREPPATWLVAALQDREIAVVVGGDGAMRMAAGCASSANVALYHCPAGTENLLARFAAMTSAPEAIVAAVEHGLIRRFDLGTFDGDPFILMASVGFDAHVVHSLAARRRGSISHYHYGPAIARALCAWRAPEIAVSVDGAALRTLGRGILVIANAPSYAFRIDPCRGAIPDDGVLDVQFLPCVHGFGAARWAVRLLRTTVEVPGTIRLRGRRFGVVLDRPSCWQVDGDPVGTLVGIPAVTIGLRGQALPILMPVPVATDGRPANRGCS